MSYQEKLREHPSTYIVQDRSNLEEMARLDIQDQMLTEGMGGVLPEIADSSILRCVLDVGCGTGRWLRDMAKTYSTIKRLFGGDISDKILSYARTQTRTQQLAERVQFKAMDALRALDFSDSYFDLVNQRLGASWLRTWEWTKILLEYQRVLRPGGIVRITESEGLIESNSPALTDLGRIALSAFYCSSRFFTPAPDGLTGELVRLLTQHDFENIQTRVHTLVLRAGTDEGQHLFKDVEIGYRVALPFFYRWTRVPSNYEQIYSRALIEMQQPDFVATWRLKTVIGLSPEHAAPRLLRGLS